MAKDKGNVSATQGIAVSIGINEKHRAKIAQGLSKLLADTYTLYLTTHNFHWNSPGRCSISCTRCSWCSTPSCGTPSTRSPSASGRSGTPPPARMSSEVQGITDTLTLATQMAAVDPSIMDYIDMKAALDVVRDVRGAPAKIFRSEEEVAAIQQENAAAQTAMAAANLGVEAGNAMQSVGQGALALKQAQEQIMPTGVQ